MRILILGAGAVGLSVAAMLSPVATVHAVCRARHARVIAAEGFSMSGVWGGARLRFSAAETPPDPGDWDYVIVACKSTDTRELAERFAPVLAGREVVSLQNGLGNEEILAGFTDRVIGGTIITGFEWRGDARVHVSVEAGPIRLGRFPAGTDPAVEGLVALLRAAGLKAGSTPSIRTALWAKTLYNCALNPLGALLGVAYGALSHPQSWAVIEEIVGEARAVCAAEGVALPWPGAAAYLEHLRTVQLPATAGHHPSMLQDLQRGRPTEIDFLNGAVASRGAALGIPTPVNATLARLIRFRESRGGAAAAAES